MNIGFPTRRPLQVYLDSSDFSRFGDVIAGRGKPENELVLRQLLRLRDTDGVEFRYSYIHIVEAAATEARHVERAIERARAIEHLCGDRALIAWSLLPLNEALGLITGEPGRLPKEWSKFHGRNDVGEWFPSFDTTFFEINQDVAAFRANPITAIRPDVIAALGPKFEAKLKTRKAKALAQRIMLRDMHKVWAAKAPQIRHYFPLSPKTESMWQRLFFGTATPEATAAAVANDLANLPSLMAWMASKGEGLGTLPQWLRLNGSALSAMFGVVRHEVEKLRIAGGPTFDNALSSRWNEAKVAVERRMEATMLSGAVESIKSESAYLERRGVLVTDAVAKVLEVGINALPSQVSMVRMFVGNFSINANPFGTPRNLDKASSDLGDMAHGWYLPYVDIMRTDRFATQYLEPAADNFSTTLESDLGNLPSTIERALG